MCGIAGYIGKSKNKDLTFELLTNLFQRLDSRGIDASGYWMSEAGSDGSVHTHKQPGKSSEFVNSSIWKNIRNYDFNLALVHARGASKGSGSPLVNKNNHPFVSKKNNIAIVHNGKIDGDEYDSLLKKYEVGSQCDSEILLRIFEQAKHQYSENFLKEYVGDILEPSRMAGIKDIFSYINEGHMAVAIGEYKNNNSRNLWLFRNEHRPLWIADTRKQLGQIFFFSDPNFWISSTNQLNEKNLKHAKLIEIVNNEIWHFSIDEENQHILYPYKFYVTSLDSKEWNYNGNVLPFAVDDIEVKTVTPLNVRESCVLPIIEDDTDKYLVELEEKIEAIQNTCRNIYSTSQILLKNNSISIDDLKEIMSLLDEQQKSLQSIENIF